MERQHSNIGNFVLQHNDNERNHVDNGSDDVVEHVDNAANDTSVPRVTRTNLSKYMKHNSLNYSHEDIHALASKAEFLVLTGSNTDLRLDNGDDGDESLVRSGPYSLDLQSLDTRYEEPCLSGTWEHDIQVIQGVFQSCIPIYRVIHKKKLTYCRSSISVREVF